MKEFEKLGHKRIDRRDFLKKSAKLGAAGLALSSVNAFPLWAEEQPLSQLGVAIGPDPAATTRAAIELVGGIKKFVSKDDIVIIKPNIGWARTPELAATTNPIVVKTIAELCFEAGAKKVRITDNTCNDARRCYAATGIGAAANEVGAEIFYNASRDYKEMDLKGDKIRLWPVNKNLIEADVFINVPIAKHHGLSKLTLGMKNHFGSIGGPRGQLHQDIHQSVVDMAAFFKPQLTVIDAIRILLRNGPTGGNPRDVAMKNTVIASSDPIAADSRATALFGMKPADLPCLALGEKRGLGMADWTKADVKEKTLG
jgi:uncharacterized protein (DUF362 family)